MDSLYRNKKEHMINTAATVVEFLIGIADDFDESMLPPLDPGPMPRTKEAQSIVEHVHSGNYCPGDPFYDKVQEACMALANMACYLSGAIVYHEYNADKEDGVHFRDDKAIEGK
jgi:hypothetical protein